jgi:hypothetical protein
MHSGSIIDAIIEEHRRQQQNQIQHRLVPLPLMPNYRPTAEELTAAEAEVNRPLAVQDGARESSSANRGAECAGAVGRRSRDARR